MPSLLSNSDIIAMLQQEQQVMLQQVVEGQKAFQLRQNQLEENRQLCSHKLTNHHIINYTVKIGVCYAHLLLYTPMVC